MGRFSLIDAIHVTSFLAEICGSITLGKRRANKLFYLILHSFAVANLTNPSGISLLPARSELRNLVVMRRLIVLYPLKAEELWWRQVTWLTVGSVVKNGLKEH